MVLSFDETKQLETTKLNNAKALMDHRDVYAKSEHDRRMKELAEQLKIAQAGGIHGGSSR